MTNDLNPTIEEISEYAPEHAAIVQRKDAKRYYVYQHRRADCGSVFYIGKGSQRRAYQFGSRPHYWFNALKGSQIDIEILRHDLHEPCALTIETIEMHVARSKGEPLTNLLIPNHPGRRI